MIAEGATTPYTVSLREQKALEMMVNAARSTLIPKKDNTKERVITNVADNEVRTSAYTISDRHQKALDVVTKKETPIMSLQEQSSSQDVYSATPQQITQALKLWKDRLIKSGDYVPHQHRSHKAHIEKIRILRGAMADYTAFNPIGSKALTFQHGKFGPLQREYHIPLFYCEPEKFFTDVARESNILYNKRICSVWEFYDYLSRDTPGYVVNRKDRRSTNQEGPIRTGNAAINPYPRDSGLTPVDNWLQSSSSSTRPIVETTIKASTSTTTSRFDITAKEDDVNPIKLTILQREAVDRTVQNKSKIRVPIPSDGDSTDYTEDEDLYDNKLLPQEKLRLKSLETDIKRIKQQNYTPKYLKDKEKAISNAEKDRLCGMVGPDYLNGVSHPWNPGAGQAPMQYDYYQIGKIERKIAKLRKINTAHVQLEYIANKPEGKGGPGGQEGL